MVAFLPSGELIAGDEAGQIALWDAQAGAILACYRSNAGFLNLEMIEEENQITLQSVQAPEVTALAVSADGKRVAVGNLKGGVQIWAVEPGF